MGKFGFPSRKKNSAPIVTVVDPPLSKAHKILGSTPLSIDGRPPKAYGNSSRGFRLSVTESLGSARDLATWSRADNLSQGGSSWGGDSDVIPREKIKGLGMVENYSEYDTDYSSALREKASSSTISSWYDKTKMPLAISQLVYLPRYHLKLQAK